MPFKGLVDSQAFADQPIETSLDLSNVRPRDVGGRRRMSKRAGTKKYNASFLSADPVRFLGQCVYDGRKNTYAAGSGSTEVSVTTPRAGSVDRACFDRQGNIYIVDAGSNISKINAQGAVVWSFQPPIAEPLQQLCTPFVDLLDNLYVGVQSGGSQTTAKAWRFTQTKGSPVPVMQWEVTPGAYVRRILVKGDSVYLALNYTDRYGSYVVAYTGALNTGITESWRTPVAYPVNDLVLKPDGALLGCSLPFASRGTDPRFPAFSRKTQDATFRDVFSDFDRRVWAHYRAEDLSLTDGDAVTVWPDSSGKNRPLTLSLRTTSTSAPIWKESGPGGLPTVRFRGSVGTLIDELQSQAAASLKAAYADGSGTLIPNYQSAMTYLLAVIRVQEDPTPTVMPALWQNKATGSAAGYFGLNTGQTNGGAAAVGLGTVDDTADASGVGMGAGPSPYRFDYTQAGGTNVTANTVATLVVSILLDGGTNAGVDNATTAHSLVRVNGKPWDRWCSLAGATVDAGYLGYSGAVAAHFKGDISEILILRDYSGASQGILSHPHYPHNIHTAAVAPVANVYNAVTATNATEMERAEGVMGHKYGVAHIFPASAEGGGAYVAPTYGGGAPFTTTNSSGNYPHPFSNQLVVGVGNKLNGPPRASNSGRSEPFLMHSPQGVAWKLDGARGELQWVVTSTTGVEDGGGIGYSIACSNSGEIIYSVGPPSPGASLTWDGTSTSLAETSSTVVRAWQDKNSTKVDGYNASTAIGQKPWIVQNQITFTGANWTNGTLTVTGTFTGYVFTSGDVVRLTAGTGVTFGVYTIASGTSTTLVLTADINGGGGNIADNSVAGTILPAWTTTEIKIDVDDHDNVHVPWAFLSSSTALSANSCVKVFAREPDGSGASNVGRLLLSYDDTAHPKGYIALCPPSPTYRYGTVPPADFERNPTGSTLSAYARSEFVWVGVAQTGTLPNTTAGLLKVRLVTATPVTGPIRQDIKIQVVNGVVAKFTTSSMPSFAGPSTLATPQLSPASEYIAGAQFGQNFMFTDGRNYVYVDPVNDTVLKWKPTDGGQMPERCKLLVNWRGRAVLARGVDDPQNWHMSEMGNPFGWDRFPKPLTSTRAVSGNNARTLQAPDLINGLIPYTDNILIFLCDKSVWALYGDPADEGQRAGLQQVSATTGGAFGDAWCLDPEGRIYFFGSRGGVYVVKPGTNVEDLTKNTVDQRLRDVDLSAFRVRMAWDVERDGLNLVFIPYDGTGTATHYFWDSRDGAWFEDEYPYSFNSLVQVDGDALAERLLLFGDEDGYIYQWDDATYGDDGAAIPTRMLIGPLTPSDAASKWRFTRFCGQMAKDYGGVSVNIYDSQTPDDKENIRLVATLRPGDNIAKPLSACAPYVWIEVTSNNATATHAIEAMTMEVYPAGRRNVATP